MADGPNRDWLEKLTIPFLFAWMFGGYLLFFKGPAGNGKQQVFRIAVFAIGMVGSPIILGLKALRNHRPGP